MDIYDDSDLRFKNMSPADQRLATARRNGEDIFDVNNRPRFPLGTGFESKLAMATHHVSQRKPAMVTDCVSGQEFERLFKAVAAANLAGVVLNTFVTISWSAAGIQADAAFRAHQGFCALLNKWFDNQRTAREGPGLKPAHIWVREYGRKFGDHSHLLVHVPLERERAFTRWARSAAHGVAEISLPRTRVGQRLQAGICHVSPNFGRSVEDQWNVFRYLMKGVCLTELYASVGRDIFKLLKAEYGELRLSSQREVTGKRTGHSRFLGKACQAQGEALLGRSIWPRGRDIHPGTSLPYDDEFLRVGERAAMLAKWDASLATLDI